MSPILLALCSNIAFATGSLLFTKYSIKTSSFWMNFYKALVACLCFAVTCTIFGLWILPPFRTLGLLTVSGALGLMIGDIFLLKAFTHLGSGRVLMIFGFQPLMLGFFSYLLFGQSFPLYRLLAVVLLIGCMMTFALESFRQKGHWDVAGLSYAFIGVALDATGILLTRSAFENSPEMSPFTANFIRSLVALVGFIILSMIPWAHFSLSKPWQILERHDRFLVTLAGFLGTFTSLSFYLMAIKTGHLGTVSAIAGTSPLFATLLETATGRKKATPYLFVGTSFFIGGLAILLLG